MLRNKIRTFNLYNIFELKVLNKKFNENNLDDNGLNKYDVSIPF
ncbi:hypothetical protein [Pseudostreptobacillus hongkongensis]|nr:hypothetical protein [Pseudostreptobacillus hongkongensis]